MTQILECEGSDMPEILTIYCHALLFKLGGQVIFTIDELSEIVRDYKGIRIAATQNDDPNVPASVTLTLKLKDGAIYGHH